MKLRTGLLIGLMVTALTITGCSSLTGEKWAAKVNGEKILTKDIDARADAMVKAYEKMGMKFDNEQGKAALQQLRSQLLEVMIGSKLVNQETKKLKLSVDDPKVKDQEEQLKKNFSTDQEYKDFLDARGMTDEELKNNLALYVYVTKDIKVSDDEVKKYFEDNIANYGGQPEQVKAKHILVNTEDEAKAIIDQLDAGKDFVELAKSKSTEPGADQSGGELGYFSKGDMVKEFSDAAFAQKVGTWSTSPVKTKFGYHVILVEDHKKAQEPDFESIKDKVKEDALTASQQQKIDTYFNDLKSKAEIQYEKSYEPAQQPAQPAK